MGAAPLCETAPLSVAVMAFCGVAPSCCWRLSWKTRQTSGGMPVSKTTEGC